MSCYTVIGSFLTSNFHYGSTAFKLVIKYVLYILDDCFNGRGRGYNGTINMTKSGSTCQHWNVQAPHQFILPSSQYPELGDHNYCRNPGSRGPDGPWCFTTDPNTRWEYCDVPKCEESQPSECFIRVFN